MSTPKPAPTRPLRATVPAAALSSYVGYLMNPYMVGDGGTRMVTIASAERLETTAERIGYQDGTGKARVTFVEYPGFHLDVSGLVDVFAVLDPPKSAASSHPDLIDGDNDRWIWSEAHQAYAVLFDKSWTGEDISRVYGSMREVGPDGE